MVMMMKLTPEEIEAIREKAKPFTSHGDLVVRDLLDTIDALKKENKRLRQEK